MISGYLRVALLMMRRKPLRSALSVLGIYIGVLSLVAILSIQAGMRRKIDNLYRTEGASVFLIQPGYDPASGKIGRLLADDVPLVASVPGVTSAIPRQTGDWKLRGPGGSDQLSCLGVDESFFRVYRVPILRGRSFLPREGRTRQPVAILTAAAARRLFPLTEAVGSFISANGLPFQVVGIADWNEQITPRAGLAQDPGLLLPVPWLLQERRSALSLIEARADPAVPDGEMMERLRSALAHGDARRHGLYIVQSLKQYLAREKELSRQALATLLAIAAISLLVGGIGVANVMLTAVTERTHEIGVRKALGARRRDILVQFLVEACLLSGSGGLLAAASARAGIALLPAVYPLKVTPEIPVLPTLGCLALTVAIGALAGLYPASKASASQPADALRYE